MKRASPGLHIGTQDGEAFHLPAAIVTQTTAILGIRGSGKTNTAVVIAEELLELGHQVVIIDPLDVWWGLKSSQTGLNEGYPVVVLGGHHADLPLSHDNGRARRRRGANETIDRRSIQGST